MPSFPDLNLNQTAVYWGNPQSDGYGGYTYDDPIEISCRWNYLTRVITGDKGVQYVDGSVVQVDRDLVKNGMLLLGELDDLDSGAYYDPIKAGASPIMGFSKTPTIGADAYYKEVFL